MRAVGPEELARLALRVARSHLDDFGVGPSVGYDHGSLAGTGSGSLAQPR
jgi:hypothetical protein